MKKLFYASTLIVMLSPLARAEKQLVSDVIDSTITVNGVLVDSSTVVQAEPAAILMTRRTFLSIQNRDASFDLYCSQKPVFDTDDAIVVPKGNSIVNLPLASGLNNSEVFRRNRLTFYCIRAAGAAASKMIVIQGY